MPEHPYQNLPDRSFWKRAVASRHYEEMESLWSPLAIEGNEKFATAGSCFAQHLGRHISLRSEANYLDLEPAPLLLPESEHSRFGYGIYSCRYGNVYTSRQLLQLAQESFGLRTLSPHVWEKQGRYYDALRPTVDPIGHDSANTVTELRRHHLDRVRQMFTELDVFIFTLGLTEAWIDPTDGTAFPTAPGVAAGDMKTNPAEFHNLSAEEVRNDLCEFWSLLKDVNPDARMILTVSPVPLIATASNDHVLPATMYSKSVLRVAAQGLVDQEPGVYYFPSYEIINSPQGRGYYFGPDLRAVNDNGVRYVMSHFFTGDLGRAFPANRLGGANDGLVCDEDLIERRADSLV